MSALKGGLYGLPNFEGETDIFSDDGRIQRRGLARGGENVRNFATAAEIRKTEELEEKALKADEKLERKFAKRASPLGPAARGKAYKLKAFRSPEGYSAGSVIKSTGGVVDVLAAPARAVARGVTKAAAAVARGDIAEAVADVVEIPAEIVAEEVEAVEEAVSPGRARAAAVRRARGESLTEALAAPIRAAVSAVTGASPKKGGRSPGKSCAHTKDLTACARDQIRNPATGRCVLRKGAIGKLLLKK
jgi:hypothetical protein